MQSTDEDEAADQQYELERAPTQEASDPSYVGHQTDAAHALLEEFQLSADMVTQVECHTSVCRIVLRLDDLNALAAFSQHVGEGGYGVATEQAPETPGLLTAYVERDPSPTEE